MKILLTGATGLLGHNIISTLLERGHEINVIVRDESKLFIQDADIHIFKGSFLNHDNLKKSAEGCDAIIHAASATDMSLGYKEFERVNVVGAQTVIDVAREMKVNNIVYISSANTIGYGTPQHLANEEDAMEFPFTESYYAQTKKIAENLFQKEAIQHPDKHIIILNPGFMLGSYDTHPSSGQLLIAAYRKALMAAPKGGKSFIHVKDVANAAVTALKQGSSGEKYIVARYNLSLREFYDIQKQVCGYKQVIINIPNWLMLCVGAFGDLLKKIGIKTQVSTINMRQLCVREYYDCSKAERDLNLGQRSINEMIKDCEEWIFCKESLKVF